MTETEKAYAKINLFLDVLSKREDGYHNIRSVMQTISLCDEVEIDVKTSDFGCISLVMENSDIPADERNLAYIAAERYMEKTEKTDAVSITVRKNIPEGAGLAGGSADAAAVLRALNRMYGNPLLTEDLVALAADIGSDVPFCLIGGTALCEGKGERIQPVPPLQGDCFVVAMPKGKNSLTANAYRLLDDAFDEFRREDRELHNALYAYFTEDRALGMFNIFETVILPENLEVEKLKGKLVMHHAVAALMSGSGVSVFGVFDDRETAEKAAKSIAGAVLCTPVPRLLP
ncbi:MAG: 4-(cytidine 5'-diphospho)-2-C-methyl-D-erythritol kinase [Clostridia bacterium]|nr:4-(cytidine 5'-diphospho)-2-C-methyl-D-erythritol kinase [Clostridia bacterium]